MNKTQNPSPQKKTVKNSDRLIKTNELIKRYARGPLLEIGASDYSFKEHNCHIHNWETLDISNPADIVVDLNTNSPRIPAINGAYQTIICTEVLEHLLWPHLVLTELNRILADDGIIIASVPNCNSLSYRFAWAIGRIPSCAAAGNLPPNVFGGAAYTTEDGGTIGGHLVDFNKSRLLRIMTHTGFTLIRLQSVGLCWRTFALPSPITPVSLSTHILGAFRKGR
jgi:hypothetical protein